mgnify:CR=1 FL=1
MEDETRENNEGNHEAGSENNSVSEGSENNNSIDDNPVENKPEPVREVSQSVSSPPVSSQPKIDNNPDAKNPWKMAAMILGIAVIALLFMNFRGGVTGNVISEGAAGEKLTGYLNGMVPEGEVEFISAESYGDLLYEVKVNYQGQELPVFITKDGEYFIQGAVPLDEPVQRPDPEPTISEYSEEDLAKITEFSQCLADNGVKAYGAGWCGYCKKLKEAFGGAEQITPFYYECQNEDRSPTEHSDLCEEEEITGFPTIKINGEAYSGPRTIEGLADAIEECDAPILSGEA